MKRKTLPQARHFSDVEKRLRVGGSAAKECTAPHFSWARAPGAGGLYKVAGACLLEQLCSAAGRRTGRAEPLRLRRPAARRSPGTPGGSPAVRRPTRHSLARGGRGGAEELGEGGDSRGLAVICAAVVVNH